MDSAEVQRVTLLVDGDKMTAGPVEVLSTLQIQQVQIHLGTCTFVYTVYTAYNVSANLKH